LAQWDKAIADLSKAIELDPSNDWLWYQRAALYLKLGDAEGYRGTCAEMLKRFGNTDRPDIAEHIAKTCSLAPDAVSNSKPVLKLADLAIEKKGSDRWILLAKGLAEYRAGRHASAVDWLKRVSPKSGGEHLDAIAFAVLTLAERRLGRTQEARAALGSAKAILGQKMPDPAKGRNFGGDWHDWLHAQILCREAEVLMGKKDQNTHYKETKDPKKKS
jgi:tetratricopeptide (TPR) repeat protein